MADDEKPSTEEQEQEETGNENAPLQDEEDAEDENEIPFVPYPRGIHYGFMTSSWKKLKSANLFCHNKYLVQVWS